MISFWKEFDALIALDKAGRIEELEERMAALSMEISSYPEPIRRGRLKLLDALRPPVPDLSSQSEGEFPRISVVTPTYNQGGFIEETIQSVLGQDYPNLQYIVVDGCSTDDTQCIVEKYADNIDIYISEEDEGQSDAINKGMSLADGEILTWINSDDLLAKDSLHTAALEYVENRFDLLIGVCRVFLEERQKFQNLHTANVPGSLQISDLLQLESKWLNGYFFHQPEVFFSRNLWERSGGAVRKNLYFSMDYEMWTRFSLHNAKIAKSSTVLSEFRAHPEQKTVSTETYLPELTQVSESIAEQFIVDKSVSALDTVAANRRSLKIVGLSDIGFMGGAGLAHRNFMKALAAGGHEVVQVSALSSWQEETSPYDAEQLLNTVDGMQPDILVFGNMHNLSPGLDIIEELSGRYHSVFVMHDLWLLSGRCAYANGCVAYLSHCTTDCHSIDRYPRLSNPGAISSHQERKRKLFSADKKTAILANSSWTLERVASVNPGLLREGRARQLALTVDHQIFYPRDQAECRRAFNIPAHSFTILIGASHLSDERKGFSVLQQVGSRFADSDVLFVFFGASQGLDFSEFNEKLVIDHIESRDELARLYSAADVFIGSSLEESFGQTFLEGMSCGLPVVAGAVGGISDIVVEGQTGFLVDPCYMASGITKSIEVLRGDEELRRKMGRNGVLFSRSRFGFMSSLRCFQELLNTSGFAANFGVIPTVNAGVESLESAVVPEVFADLDIGESRQVTAKHEQALDLDELSILNTHGKEISDGRTVIWLKKFSTILLPVPAGAVVNSLFVVVRHAPMELRDWGCAIAVNGKEISEFTWSEGDVLRIPVHFRSPKSAVAALSLSFEKEHELTDGRRVTLLIEGVGLAVA